MKSSRQKLHSRRGETLVEVLAAVLICTLAVLMLTSFAVAAMRIDKTAETGDETFYAALNAAEAQGKTTPDPAWPSPTTGTIKVENSTGGASVPDLPVQFYGGDGVYSFAKGGSGP